MAIGWMTVLQNVPWTDVVRNAPKVAAGAKKLWDAAAKKMPSAQDMPATEPALVNDPVELAKSVLELENQVARLHEQMTSSSALIRALAEQNSELINSVQALRRRLAWVSAAAVLAVALAGIALVNNVGF